MSRLLLWPKALDSNGKGNVFGAVALKRGTT
jgi:hypothetical protein